MVQTGVKSAGVAEEYKPASLHIGGEVHGTVSGLYVHLREIISQQGHVDAFFFHYFSPKYCVSLLRLTNCKVCANFGIIEIKFLIYFFVRNYVFHCEQGDVGLTCESPKYGLLLYRNIVTTHISVGWRSHGSIGEFY